MVVALLHVMNALLEVIVAQRLHIPNTVTRVLLIIHGATILVVAMVVIVGDVMNVLQTQNVVIKMLVKFVYPHPPVINGIQV